MVHSTIKVHFLAFPSLRSLINICLCQLGHISNLSDSKDGTRSEVCLQMSYSVNRSVSDHSPDCGL